MRGQRRIHGEETKQQANRVATRTSTGRPRHIPTGTKALNTRTTDRSKASPSTASLNIRSLTVRAKSKPRQAGRCASGLVICRVQVVRSITAELARNMTSGAKTEVKIIVERVKRRREITMVVIAASWSSQKQKRRQA